MDQQRAQVTVASLADPADALFATASLDAQRQPEPRREVPRRLELPAVADRGDERRGRHRPDAWGRGKALACLVCLVPSQDARLDHRDPLPQGIDVVEQAPNGLAGLVREHLRFELAHAAMQLVHPPDALARHDAELAKQTARGVDRCRPLPHQQRPNSVSCQDALLLARLDRDEAHVRPAHRLADRLGVGSIGLVTLDVGLDVLRRDQAHGVTKPDELARPMVGAGARLHADQAGRLLGEEGGQLAARQPAPEHGAAGRIDAMHLEDGLRKVEADRDN